jgi:hypothetical protein
MLPGVNVCSGQTGSDKDEKRSVFILCRYAGLRVWHAAVCVIFGFYLASSSLVPDITNVMTSLFRLL